MGRTCTLVGMHVDVIIIGQGIAGTLLADRLYQYGKSVAVIDQGLHASATAIAAGLMEPMSGRKLAKAWEAETVFPEAIAHYQSLEKRLGLSLIQTLPVSRYFSEEQALLWQTKQKQFRAFSWMPVPVSESAPYGGVTMTGAVVKTTRLLAAMRSRFRRRGMLHGMAVSEPETLLKRTNPYGLSGDHVVCAAGVGIAQMACWQHLRLQYSSGDVLCLRYRSVPALQSVVHDHKRWMVPYASGQVRIGASYRPFTHAVGVTLADARDLQDYAAERLGGWVYGAPQAVYSGGRCLGMDGRFWMGPHPTISGLWTLTGLGSKGVMFAPHLTMKLAEAIEVCF